MRRFLRTSTTTKAPNDETMIPVRGGEVARIEGVVGVCCRFPTPFRSLLALGCPVVVWRLVGEHINNDNSIYYLWLLIVWRFPGKCFPMARLWFQFRWSTLISFFLLRWKYRKLCFWRNNNRKITVSNFKNNLNHIFLMQSTNALLWKLCEPEAKLQPTASLEIWIH